METTLERRANTSRQHGSRLLLRFVLRTALRDLRGGLSGFGIFLGCIALGVAAIVGVGSLSHGLSDGLSREGRRILGGDLAFSTIHRNLSAQELAFLQSQGTLNTIANLRAMVRVPAGDTALVELKSVDGTYPALGDVELSPAMPLAKALAQRDGMAGVVVEQALADRLNVQVGDQLILGDATLVLRAILLGEPDKLAAGLGFGPRAMVSQDVLATTGLVQPGSLIRWTTRLQIAAPTASPVDAAAVNRVMAQARQAFPEAGWEVRTRANVSPQFSKNLERFAEFLTLVGLTSLIVGGVGVANAVRVFVDAKRADFATLKSLGATGSVVFAISLIEVMAVALVGIAMGLVLGALIPFGVGAGFGSLLPFPLVASVYPGELLAGLAYGALTALTFSLLPLGLSHDVPVSMLFRDDRTMAAPRPRWRYVIFTALSGTVLLSLIVALSYDRKLALIYMVATLIGFVLLRGVGLVVMAIARRIPHPHQVEWRLALGNIHRAGALTPSVVLSLGLGLALLVALTLIDGNIRNELTQTNPGKTPSFFFLDVQSAQAPSFDAFLQAHVPDAKIERVPMMRGRVLKVKDVPVDQVKAREDIAWVLEGDRGITYAATLPEGSDLTAGSWWAADDKGPPLVSMESAAAEGLGLKVGDTITINVLGRSITATIANLRKVNWRNLGINFVFVFSPHTFAGAPHTLLATATFPQGGDPKRESNLLRDVAKAFPAVTSVRVKDALDTLSTLVAQLGLAIRGASSVALLTSVLVLAGALAAGQRARLYDAVVLKTLGATRWRLLLALVLEYALLGLATAVFGVLAGEAIAWGVVTKVMGLSTYTGLWGAATGAAAIALVVTIVLGLVGTWRVLGEKPARYLRSL